MENVVRPRFPNADFRTISSLLLIMIVELLNSGIEAVVDRIGPEQHRLSGLAKDVGSAAVFMSLLNAAVVWLLVLFARWG